MITRKIGKLVRGKATPFQIVSAAVLGGAIAFLPGFGQAAGLYVLLVATLVVLNANLGVAVMVGLPAKLLSLALMPVSFQIGSFLLDGPAAPVFRAIVNAPVLAYFGLEYYVTTGGLVLGVAIGLVAGGVLAAMLGKLRRVFSNLEVGSPRYQELASKRWVKFATVVFLGGGRGKKTYNDLLRTKVGNPIRVSGVIMVVCLVGFGVAFNGLLASSLLTNALQRGLERANGATVDLAEVELDLGEGRLRVAGLAMADRDALDTDVFRGMTFEADLSTADALRKRFRIERLVIQNASTGEKRSVPGERIGPEEEPAGPKPEATPTLEDELSLEEVFEDAEAWRGRLETARYWLERLSPDGSDADGASEETDDESLRERLERRAQELGYTDRVASHLIDAAPRIVVSELVVEGLRIPALDGEILDIRATNLSSAPHLLAAAPRVTITSRSESIEAFFELGGLTAGDDSAGSRVVLALRGLSVDALAGGLSVRGKRPVEGGTMDLVVDGGWSGGRVGHIDLPLMVTLHDTTITVPGHGQARVNEFSLPIALRGPIDDPAIRVDDGELADALLEAGKTRLANRLRSEVDEAVSEVEDKVSDAADQAREELEEELEAELAERGIDKDDVKEQAKKKAGGLLRDVLDRK